MGQMFKEQRKAYDVIHTVGINRPRFYRIPEYNPVTKILGLSPTQNAYSWKSWQVSKLGLWKTITQ